MLSGIETEGNVTKPATKAAGCVAVKNRRKRARIENHEGEVVMAGKLRVFISSTMNDMANERDAVIHKLVDFNFEPVNAETLSPTGAGSWSLLSDELASSDVLLLILGERYGWIPSNGPQADSGRSVTEIEYLEARRLGLPILPFFKRLSYGADRSSDDALHRDRFRREVEDWATGQFRGDFELAHDLADKAGVAVLALLTNSYKKHGVLGLRRASARTPGSDLVNRRPADLVLPEALVEVVADHSAMLFAGAGMSLQAGIPSVSAFTEGLLARLREADPSYRLPIQGHGFNTVASDYSLLLGSDELMISVADLIGVQGTASPTQLHATAARRFDVVLTTNYDNLLERADGQNRWSVIDRELEEDDIPQHALIKLHGTFDDAESLVLTESDLAKLSKVRPRLLEAIRKQLRARPLVVVGSSLRDPSIIDLLDSCRPQLNGWVVAPHFQAVERLRLERWRLRPITATAEEFFSALTAALGSRNT
jgi:hypothetical protein